MNIKINLGYEVEFQDYDSAISYLESQRTNYKQNILRSKEGEKSELLPAHNSDTLSIVDEDRKTIQEERLKVPAVASAKSEPRTIVLDANTPLGKYRIVSLVYHDSFSGDNLEGKIFDLKRHDRGTGDGAIDGRDVYGFVYGAILEPIQGAVSESKEEPEEEFCLYRGSLEFGILSDIIKNGALQPSKSGTGFVELNRMRSALIDAGLLKP